MTATTKPVTAKIEADFRQFLETVYGLYIHPHQKDRLKQAINSVSEKFSGGNPERLLAKLKADEHCDERIMLVQMVTVDESYFFRDENQHHFLATIFLPQLIAKKRRQGDKYIRIWSAGCSTGQEIYSIAILLHQLLYDFSDWQLQLIGSDINHRSLKHALKAEYNEWEIRSEQIVTQSCYFSPVAKDRYQLNEDIRKQVTFFFLNLAEDIFPSLMNRTCNLDLILCRNVFIYFKNEMIQNTCDKFAQALNPGGVLLLSATDPMSLTTPLLNLHQSGDVFYFERREKTTVVDNENQTDFKSLSQWNVSVAAENLPPKPIAEKLSQNKSASDFFVVRSQILSSLANNQWQDVLAMSEQALITYPTDPDLAQFKAKALVNLGQLQEAKLACEESIKLNDLDPHSYLLYGLILLQLNLYDEAEKAFRQTLFLNSGFVEAHYQLGQVLLHKGLLKKGLKAIKNALVLAEQGEKNRPIHNVVNLTYASFAETIKHELVVLGVE